jgi:hypothetical protein
MLPAGFEPTIPVSERAQTHALDRAVTAIDDLVLLRFAKNYFYIIKFKIWSI